MNRKDERFFSSLNLKEGGRILISGGNSGIGYECTRYLLRKKWTIYWAVRILEKANEAKNRLLEEFEDGEISILHLNLSLPESMKSFIENIKEGHLDFDVFYMNAGIYRVPYEEAYGRLESQVAVNFVSNLYLFEELFDYLNSLGHIVKYILTSSVAARLSSFDENCFYGGKKYKKAMSYNYSKVGVNMLYLYALRKAEGTNIFPLLVHPGIVYTPLIEKAYHGKTFILLAKRFMRAFFNKTPRGALPALFVIQENVDTPMFVGPKGIGHTRGLPKPYRLYQGNLKNKDEMIEKAKEIIKDSI